MRHNRDMNIIGFTRHFSSYIRYICHHSHIYPCQYSLWNGTPLEKIRWYTRRGVRNWFYVIANPANDVLKNEHAFTLTTRWFPQMIFFCKNWFTGVILLTLRIELISQLDVFLLPVDWYLDQISVPTLSTIIYSMGPSQTDPFQCSTENVRLTICNASAGNWDAAGTSSTLMEHILFKLNRYFNEIN